MGALPLLSRLSGLFATPVPDFGRRPTPSADLYFVNALSDLIGTSGQHPVRRLGNNLFAAGDHFVLVRYATPEELAVLSRARRGTFYVVDDDFAAIAADKALPADYRRRLEAFTRRVLPRILAVEPVIVAPNPRLFKAYGKSDGLLIEPAHGPLCTDFSHFEQPAMLRLVFSGTRSHAADLAAVAAGVAQFLAGRAQARLVTFLGAHAPRPLRRHPQVENRPALAWPEYKAALGRERFHLALAPFIPTPANEARSANKINDHAAFGAAGLYGNIAPYRDRVSQGHNGLLVEDDPEAWRVALEELASDPHRMRTIAEAGAALASRLGDPQRQRWFWLQQLGL